EENGSLEHPQLRERAVDLSRTKTNRPRSVPLDSRALAILTSIPVHLKSKYVFWHGEDGDRYRRISNLFAEHMKTAVKEKRVKRAFAFHHLRHWFAVDYLRTPGHVIYDLQKILGHSSLTTTEMYLDFLTPEEADLAKRPAQI